MKSLLVVAHRMPGDMQIVNNAVCLGTFHSIFNSFTIFLLCNLTKWSIWQMDVWECSVCAKPLFLSTDYIFFRQIFKQQPYCDALLTIKNTHTKPRQQAGESWGGRKLNKYSIKNLSKNIMLYNPLSSSLFPWIGCSNRKWLLGMKTYVPCSTKQLNMCLTLCMFLRPFILSSAFTSACASLNWIHSESLSTCTTKLWTRGVIFLKVLRS